MPDRNEELCSQGGPSPLTSFDPFGWFSGRQRLSRVRRITFVLIRYGLAELTAAVVLAAIIIGASLLVLAAPTMFKWLVPAIGVAAFVLAGAIGIYLFISVLRRG